MARRAKTAAAAEQVVLPELLMRAIAAAPQDDAPRLVAADWYAEHGDPGRAELISLQCQLEQLHPASPEREPLDARIRALLQPVPESWRPSLPHLEFGLVRGFPGAVVGEPSDVAAAALQLTQLALPIERLGLSKLTDVRGLEKLLLSPLCAGICQLNLDGLDDASASLLFESGKFPRLEHLVIERCEELSRHSWGLLAGGAQLARLQSLQLFNAPAREWVRAGPTLPALRRLELVHGGLVPEPLKALARTATWSRLETLSLSSSPLATEGARVFFEAPPRALTALDLSWCRLAQEGLKALAKMEVRLKVLKLRHNALTGASLMPLIDAPCTVGLEWLDVRKNDIEPRTLSALRERFGTRLLYDR